MPDPINQPIIPQTFPEMPDVPVMPQDTSQVPTQQQTTPTQPATTPTKEVQQEEQPMDIPPIISEGDKPKKKGGKIFATILGIFLLIGAVGAGVVLVNQNQDIREKASACVEEFGNCGSNSDCCTGLSCTSGKCQENTVPPPPTACGDNLDCSQDSSVSGVTACSTGDSNNPITYCCPTNKVIVGGSCVDRQGGGLNPPPCETGLSCSPDGTVVGSVMCSQPNTQQPISYCCPKGQIILNGKCSEQTSTINCSSITKTSTGISIPSNLYPTCWISHYWCPNMTRATAAGGCSEQTLAAGVQSASFTKDCGVEQIDFGCTTDTSCKGFVSAVDRPACDTTPPGETARCESVKAYDSEWNLLDSTQLSTLSAGDVVRFTVNGSPADKIDKARFTITPTGGDITQSGEVIDKKPGTDEYYYEYVIPAGVTSFNVTAQVHHITLLWF